MSSSPFTSLHRLQRYGADCAKETNNNPGESASRMVQVSRVSITILRRPMYPKEAWHLLRHALKPPKCPSLCQLNSSCQQLMPGEPLPTNSPGPRQHPPKIQRGKTLRIVCMLRIMLFDQIVRQLMTYRDPPVRHGLYLSFSTTHLLHMQLFEISEVAEQRPVAVESYGGAGVVVENVESGGWEGEDFCDGDEEDGEGGEGVFVGGEEGCRVRVGAREEEFDAVIEVRDECQIVTWSAVAIGGGLFDVICFGRREERGGVVGSGSFDGAVEVLVETLG